jgi:tetratricopeptide (TPR) repeat protein
MTASAYEQALGDFLCHRGNPLALARRAEGLRGRLLEASLLLCSRDIREFEQAGWLFASLKDEKHPHVAAIGAAVDGDLARACRVYDRILEEQPGDLLALAVAQVFDYYLGNPQSLLARSAKALRARPDHHAVLSMHAFALEECGDYARAEALGRRALELEPLDLRAHHAVAHVMEMQGRFEEGVRWMGGRSRWWRDAGPASTHLWWHLALYHVEVGRPAHALAIYERRMQGDGLSELIDASALLWRLHLQGIELQSSFQVLAARWSPYAEDAHCAFNDLHAMMAFVGAGRWDCVQRLLAAQEQRARRRWGANHDMTQLVGLPACRALAAFGRGDYPAAERLLRALPPVAHRIGGSHAQRDVLLLTRFAALRNRGQSPISIRALTPISYLHAA